MKKLLFLFLVCFSLIANVETYASDDTPDSDSTELEIEISSKDNSNSFGPQRSPRRIDIEVFYSESLNSITIHYNGEIEGEVYIYRNNVLVDYETQINSIILLPYSQGNYKIEIITNSWIAKAYLDI